MHTSLTKQQFALIVVALLALVALGYYLVQPQQNIFHREVVPAPLGAVTDKTNAKEPIVHAQVASPEAIDLLTAPALAPSPLPVSSGSSNFADPRGMAMFSITGSIMSIDAASHTIRVADTNNKKTYVLALNSRTVITWKDHVIGLDELQPGDVVVILTGSDMSSTNPSAMIAHKITITTTLPVVAI